ncbi:hypothetical protein VTK73DRAFT_1413 [Phialemonium thermophilum]|uniref:Uncharacterized protein n=1 Tax=Phialemonium thermophilum TaxID=223376 RepID=A0ABR3VTN4_9PEZI
METNHAAVRCSLASCPGSGCQASRTWPRIGCVACRFGSIPGAGSWPVRDCKSDDPPMFLGGKAAAWRHGTKVCVRYPGVGAFCPIKHVIFRGGEPGWLSRLGPLRESTVARVRRPPRENRGRRMVSYWVGHGPHSFSTSARLGGAQGENHP